MNRFTHLGLDTSVLIGSSWPSASVTLRNIVAGCQKLGIPVLIPEIVLSEAEAEWMRITKEAIDAARNAVSRMREKLPGIDIPMVALPDERTRIAAHADARRRLADEWNWVAVPLPPASLAEAVDRAIRHEPPFPADDSDFRDGLIVWSLLEHLKAGDVLGLIAPDGAFSDRRMVDAAKARGIELRVYKSPPDAWEDVEEMVKLTAARESIAEWEARTREIVKALEGDRDRLDTFVRENIRIPERPYGIEGRIEAVHAVQVMAVHSALLPVFKDNWSDASAELAIQVVVTVSRYTPTPPRVMRVGESADDVSRGFGDHERRVIAREAWASVKLKVTWSDDGRQPQSIEYLDVEFGTSEERLLESVAMREALGRA